MLCLNRLEKRVEIGLAIYTARSTHPSQHIDFRLRPEDWPRAENLAVTETIVS